MRSAPLSYAESAASIPLFDGRPPLAGKILPHNRRYLGGKSKLVGFIAEIVAKKCGKLRSFCDIFAGTGAVAWGFNRPGTKIIVNDFLTFNHVCLRAFFAPQTPKSQRQAAEKISHLNALPADEENYFSRHFGGSYFSPANARKIGAAREEINRIADNEEEKSALLCSLIYAADKAANTVGHYDAFRKKLDSHRPLRLFAPAACANSNANNETRQKDANALVKEISCDVLYVDPPYNSRQYADAYHLLENLAEWKKPPVEGKCKKMRRDHIKSRYCGADAARAFAELVASANCRHLLLSYNNTGDGRDSRSNARMRDDEILEILNRRGEVEVFERRHKAFTAGKSADAANAERVFYCRCR